MDVKIQVSGQRLVEKKKKVTFLENVYANNIHIYIYVLHFIYIYNIHRITDTRRMA